MNKIYTNINNARNTPSTFEIFSNINEILNFFEKGKTSDVFFHEKCSSKKRSLRYYLSFVECKELKNCIIRKAYELIGEENYKI